MFIQTTNTMQYMYRHLLKSIIARGNKIKNTLELTNTCFTINSIDNVIIEGRTDPAYAIGELCWYLDGDNTLKFIEKFSPFWKNISDDGVTCNSAYGYILAEREGFNQIDKVIELLKKDPNTRRAVLNINKANENVIDTHDEQCTVAIQFLIRDNKLNTTVFMRSNDIVRGLPYDVLYFTTLAKYVASVCKVKYGTYTHFVTSLHIYIKDIPLIDKLINGPMFLPRYKINVKYLYKYYTWICTFVRSYNFDSNNSELRKQFKNDVITMAKSLNILEENY